MKRKNIIKNNITTIQNKLKIIELSLKYKEYKFTGILVNNFSSEDNIDERVSKILLEIIYKNYDLSLKMIEEYFLNNSNKNKILYIDYINITLTPSSYLQSNYEKEIRKQFFSNSLENPTLSLEHDKNNQYDDLAIKIFCNGTIIGYILKYKDKENINSFCFEHSKLKNLYVIFDNDTIKICLDTNQDSSNSSVDHMGDGMYINDNDRWW